MERMHNLLETISRDLLRILQSRFTNSEFWTAHFPSAKEKLEGAIEVLRIWSSLLSQATLEFWTEAAEKWTKGEYNSKDCVRFQKRLREVRATVLFARLSFHFEILINNLLFFLSSDFGNSKSPGTARIPPFR
jgi:hypothetical protein